MIQTDNTTLAVAQALITLRDENKALKAENERLKCTLEKVKNHLVIHRDHSIQSCRQDGKTFHVMNEFLAIFCNDLLQVINTDQKGGEDD